MNGYKYKNKVSRRSKYIKKRTGLKFRKFRPNKKLAQDVQRFTQILNVTQGNDGTAIVSVNSFGFENPPTAG